MLKFNTDFFKKDFAIGFINLNQKALLAKNLSVMQKAGIDIVESLSIIIESSQGRMKKILEDILLSLRSGNTLAESFARHSNVFSGIFISSIYAGEKSGSLADNLENLSITLQKEKQLLDKIKGAMFYPAIVLVASFGLALVMSFVILPKIVPLFEGLRMELPWTTRALMSFSNFINDHKVILSWSIFIFITAFIILVKQKFSHPVTHYILLKFPIISRLVRNTNLSRFSRIFGSLLRSGLSIDEALSVTEKSLDNYYYKKAIRDVLARIKKGVKASESLKAHSKYFPKMVSRMVYVGEESGKMEDTLLYMADFYEDEVDNSTKSLSTALEPILLLFIGVVVGFLAISIITPIYNVTGNIKG
ncbi:MAG: type II secretion system F family protein [Candidatus Magasanikbacteria bacterium]